MTLRLLFIPKIKVVVNEQYRMNIQILFHLCSKSEIATMLQQRELVLTICSICKLSKYLPTFASTTK